MSKHFLNKNHLRIVYYSLIHPHLTQKYIRKLEILPKKSCSEQLPAQNITPPRHHCLNNETFLN